MDLKGKTTYSEGTVAIADNFLGKGGEGSVYAVNSHNISGLPEAEHLVAKIYHNPEEGNRARKIIAMLKMPPESNSVAWPKAMLLQNGKFVGYLMEKLEAKGYRTWAELSNSKDRKETSPDFDVQYALTSSRNLAASLDSIHQAGHITGDINESNIFVGINTGIFIVDTDSAQILSENGTIFPCTVGKPEYTAPEISYGSLKDNKRTIPTDVFAYAVAVFQMLTGGAHPTDGIFLNKNEDPPATIIRIREGIYPALDPNNAKSFKPVARIPTKAIPTNIRKVLIAALNPDPAQRPTMLELIREFDSTLGNLQQCQKIKAHWFDSRDGSCGWCQHLQSGNLDPWSKAAPKPSGVTQITLPGVSFSPAQQAPQKARRAPVSVPQTNQGNHSQQQLPSNSQNYGNSQNSSNGNNQQNNNQQAPQQNYNNQQPQSNQPRHPKKYKGKVILDYADGTWDVRPPIMQLMRRNPKLAFRCIKDETPAFAKAWWDTSRPVAILWSLFVGLFISLGISASWYFLVPKLNDFVNIGFLSTETTANVFSWLAIAAVITSTFGCLYLFFSALSDMMKAKKQYNGLGNLKREKPWKTALRFLPLPIVYGPILTVVLIVLLILGLFNFILAVIRTPQH